MFIKNILHHKILRYILTSKMSLVKKKYDLNDAKSISYIFCHKIHDFTVKANFMQKIRGSFIFTSFNCYIILF